MLVLFEAFLVKDADPAGILSAETLQDTAAQVMTIDEARAVGFGGLPEPGDKVVRFVAVSERDLRRVQHALETNPIVTSFRMHKVG